MTDEQAHELWKRLADTAIVWLKENDLAGSFNQVSLYHELDVAVKRYQKGVSHEH